MTRLEDFAASLTREMWDAYDQRMDESYRNHPNERLEDAEEAGLAEATAVATSRIRELARDFDCATQGPLNRYLDGAGAAKETR